MPQKVQREGLEVSAGEGAGPAKGAASLVFFGCHSQGATREEAVENIKIAIREWLQVEADESGVSKVEEDLVAI